MNLSDCAASWREIVRYSDGRKVFRRFAAAPKGREHNNHGRTVPEWGSKRRLLRFLPAIRKLPSGSLVAGPLKESSEYLTTVGILYDFVPGYSAIPEIHQSVNSLVYRYLNIPEQCLRFWHSGCYFNVQHEIPYETKNDSHQ